MDGVLDLESKQGSLWHRWDPHLHTPGTALNNQYRGANPWEDFLKAIETSDPPIRALGITDYFGIERGKLDQLTEAWAKNEWIKNNALIAVAGGEKDGTSGLRDATASFAAQRRHVERMAHVVFSTSPQQINFWLGRGSASVAELESQYNGTKPCLHGSDAHSSAKVGQPDASRFCWLKGDLTFESLRQACIEPAERVYIGAEPPRGALEGHTISAAMLSDLKVEREDAGLSATDWEAFKVDYVGTVDSLLTERIKQASLLVAGLKGPAKTDPAIQQNPDRAMRPVRFSKILDFLPPIVAFVAAIDASVSSVSG